MDGGGDLEEDGKGKMIWYEMRYRYACMIYVYIHTFKTIMGKKGKIE